MTSDLDDLCRAVAEFLGFGIASSPQHNRERLAQAFGTKAGGELELRVNSLVDEVGRIEVDWSQHNLESAGRLARQTMRDRHPELCERALSALEWKFTFDWR